MTVMVMMMIVWRRDIVNVVQWDQFLSGVQH